MLVKEFERYTFVVDSQEVGYIEIRPTQDYDYCVYFEIFKDFRGQGYATKLIDEYRQNTKRPFRFSYVGENTCGGRFWTKYIVGKNAQKIKGLTYEIKY